MHGFPGITRMLALLHDNPCISPQASDMHGSWCSSTGTVDRKVPGGFSRRSSSSSDGRQTGRARTESTPRPRQHDVEPHRRTAQRSPPPAYGIATTVISSSVWTTARMQHEVVARSIRRSRAADHMLIAMLDQETGHRGSYRPGATRSSSPTARASGTSTRQSRPRVWRPNRSWNAGSTRRSRPHAAGGRWPTAPSGSCAPRPTSRCGRGTSHDASSPSTRYGSATPTCRRSSPTRSVTTSSAPSSWHPASSSARWCSSVPWATSRSSGRRPATVAATGGRRPTATPRRSSSRPCR